MFNSGIRGKRARDNEGTVSPQSQFIQKTFPQPTITSWSVNGVDDLALDTAGGQTVIINGSGFTSGATATLGGTLIGSVTLISSTQISFTAPAKSAGTYALVVYYSSGTASILAPGITYSGIPTFTTAAGSVGNVYETSTINTNIVATGDSTLTYTVTSGSLPSGVTLSSGGLLSGTAPISNSITTYTFGITATDAELQDVTRTFTLTINTDVVTFSTPTSGSTIVLEGSSYSQTLSATSAAGKSITYSADTLPTGLTLTSGTVNGTPTVEGNVTTIFTATASTTNRTGTSTIYWSVQLGDPYISTTPLLLSANTYVQTSSFVTDNSSNNLQLAIYGDTRATNFNPHQFGYYSYSFDGSGDALNAGSNSNFALGTGPFCIEAWIYNNLLKNYSCLVTTRPDNGSYADGYHIGWDSVGGVSIYVNTTSYAGGPSGTIKVGKWQHFVCCRDASNNTSIFVDGVRTSGSPATLSSNFTRSLLGIGDFPTTQAECINGYISNLRLVKGYSVYDPTQTSLTIPTEPLKYITGTSLLTAQSNRFIDNSPTNATLTRVNDTKVSMMNPFPTVYQPGTQYYSTYFNGSSDYINVATASSTALNFGTDDYTIECWVNYNGTGSGGYFIVDNGNGANFLFRYNSGTTLQYYTGSTLRIGYPVTLTPGTWYHLAVVRYNSNYTLYINGSSVYNNASVETVSNGATNIGIGAKYNGGTDFFGGTISNLRITKSAVYTSSFTPSTTPLTALANTVVLTCQNSTFKDNSTNNFTVTGATASVKPLPISPFTPTSFTSTAITTYGSAYLDGTGDYILTSPTGLEFGSNNFTIELWWYPTSTVRQALYHGSFGVDYSVGIDYSGVSTNQKIGIWASSNGTTWNLINADSGGNGIGTISIIQYTWNHIAYVRNGTTWQLYVNGVRDLNLTGISGSIVARPTYPKALGVWWNTTAMSPALGYISDFRIVNGTALYSSSFVPQFTGPSANIANTQLLTLQYNGSHNNTSFRDSSNYNTLVARTGNATNGTFSPYGDNWSFYLGGTQSDYIDITNMVAIGTGDFTVECWVFMESSSQYDGYTGFFSSAHSSGASGVVMCRDYFWVGNGSSSPTITSSASMVYNQWMHVAITRSGTTVRGFVNGTVLGATQTSSLDLNSTQGRIGSRYYDTMAYGPLKGYVSNLRIVKGTALYTSSFTVGASILTAISKTVLLTANTNRFSDISATNATMSRAGTAMVQRFAPYSSSIVPRYYSTIFNGSTDYISNTTGTSLAFGTDLFTVELWFNISTLPASSFQVLLTTNPQNTNGFQIYRNGTSGNIVYGGINVAENIILASGNYVANQWYHIAVVRSGTGTNQTKTYVNGVQSYQYTDAGNYNINGFNVGGYNASIYFTGLISNVRAIKGTALYSSTFTPSTTPLTAVSGTTLLTCQDNVFKDNSANALAITANTTTVKPLPVSPFLPTPASAAYYSSSTFGGSIYFDGSGDYVTPSATTGLTFGTGDYTIEVWAYAKSISDALCVFVTSTPSAYTHIIRYGATTGWQLYYPGGSTGYTFNTTDSGVNAWVHHAVSRSGGTLRWFVNGIQVFSVANTTDVTDTVVTLGNYAGYYWNGYIADFKVTKGVGLYTSNFYPGVTPSGTSTSSVTTTGARYPYSMILSGATNGIIDANRHSNLETVGDVKVTRFSPYNGTSYSAYFDGTNSSLTFPMDSSVNFGTGSFTIELWYFGGSDQSDRFIIDARNGGGTSHIHITTGGYGGSTAGGIRYVPSSGTMIYTTTVVTDSKWHHVAIVRNGTTNITIYIDGVSAATGTDSGNYSGSGNVVIGTNSYSGGTFANAYYSNLRIVKGTAVYTSAFTPSTTPLTAISGTSVLTCQSNKFVDNSTNAFTITNNGNARVATLNPFQINDGQSYYFDGTGDYIRYPLTAYQPLGTKPFTIEFWLFFIGRGANGSSLVNNYTTWTTGSLGIFAGHISANTTKYQVSYNGSGFPNLNTSTSIIYNQWHHIAVVRDTSNTIKFYINGVADSSTILSASANLTGSGSWQIGDAGDGIGSYSLNGYITDLRITAGYARYTSNFTPNTTSLKIK